MAREQASVTTEDKSAARKDSALTPSDGSAIGLQGKWKGWDLRATGMYAGAVLSAVATASFLLWTNPLSDARHFLLTMLSCFVSGAFFSVGMCHGRLQDALKTQSDFRHEMNQMAERNRELEKIILRTRLSSAGPATPTLENKPPDSNGTGKSNKQPNAKLKAGKP